MSKGKTKSTSSGTSSSTQTLNPWAQGQFTDQTARVRGLMDSNPVQAYSGPMTAGLSGNEQNARTQFQGLMGSFNPAFDRASTDLNNAGLQADFGAVSDQYMNPFEQQVIDTTMSDIGRMNEGQNAAMRGRAAASGAYGGSGVAVGQALNNEAAQREMARTGSQLRYQGYNDARGLFGQDINARERRALGTADLASRQHDMGMRDIAGLDQLGQTDRGIEQSGMDRERDELLRQQEERQRRVQNEMGLLGSIPMLTNQTGRNTGSQTQSTHPGLLGTLGQVAQIGSTAMMMSDARVKEDIVPLGVRKGHNWYGFRYVWDKPGVKRQGVMAQEVRQTRPDAVGERGGFLMVDYDALGLEML